MKLNKDNRIKIGTNKSFGIVFFLLFLIISIFPLFKDGEIRIWSLFIGIFFLVTGLMNSKILTPLNKFWFKFGILLGSFVSPIVRGIVFFMKFHLENKSKQNLCFPQNWGPKMLEKSV